MKKIVVLILLLCTGLVYGQTFSGSPKINGNGISIAELPPNGGGGGGSGAADNLYCTTAGTWIGATTDGPAALPTACYYTALSGTPSPGTVRTTTAANLLTTYNAAACGDVIVVTGGTSQTAQTTLTGKGCDNAHYITIEGSEVSDPNFPPEGTMASPLIAGVSSLPNRPAFSGTAPALHAPQFIAPASSSAFVLNGADHIRFIGLELTRVATGGVPVYSIVDLTSGTGTQTNHIIIDRCWVHGINADGAFPQPHSTDTSTSRGVWLAQSNTIAVIDSYFSDFYDNGAGTVNSIVYGSANGNTDAQAIAGGVGSTTNSGWGVYKVVNNHLEGASETILTGGSGGPALTPNGCTFGVNCNLDVPTNLEIRRNELFKSPAWNYGTNNAAGYPNVKNGIEFKTGNQILFENNVSENGWYDSQPATYAWDIAPKNQSNGSGVPICPSCLDRNVTVRYNYAYNYPYGPAIYSTADIGCSTCTTRGDFISVHDNVWGDSFTFTTGSGGDNLEFLADAGPMTNIRIVHNTGLAASRALMIFGSPAIGNYDQIVIQDNLFAEGQYGVQAASNSNAGCDNGGTGGAVYDSTNNFLGILTHCVNGTTNTWTADHNIIWGSNAITNWPTGNTKVAAIANVGFTTVPANNTFGYPDSGFTPADWQLTAGSVGHNAASDGTDVGADIPGLITAISGVRK